MNEQIQKLAERAGLESFYVEYSPWQVEFEKFAKLLIMECVQVAVEQKQWVEAQQPAFNYDDARWDCARIQQSKRIIEKIKEHFGIEL